MNTTVHFDGALLTLFQQLQGLRDPELQEEWNGMQIYDP